MQFDPCNGLARIIAICKKTLLYVCQKKRFNAINKSTNLKKIA